MWLVLRLNDDDHSGLGSVKISEIFVRQDTLFFATEPIDKVYRLVLPVFKHRSYYAITCQDEKCLYSVIYNRI